MRIAPAPRRIVVLPDDTMVLELLDQAEKLLEVLSACEQDSVEDPDEPTPWRLPAPIADGLAASALARVASARGLSSSRTGSSGSVGY